MKATTGKNRKLTPKQKRFCREYLVDLNATQAAIRAEYSKKTATEQASRLLTKVNIQKEIERLQKKRADKLDIIAEDVLKKIALLGNYDIRKLYNDDGSLKPIHELDDETAAAIQGIDFNKKDKTVKVKLFDKRAALVLLGRHLGIFERDNKQRGNVVIYKITDVNIPDDAGISK